ncbi:hypothetical protein ACIOD2_22645 [Amycolatopsis sp. NPDC088138]|uniref:hypothetical protein n=1 Tax=Amycolatopsis sp. NPDC088138 TaxID=3363938 RepID=UPI003817702E
MFMKYSAAELQKLAGRASSLARRIGARRFVMRPGKLTQLLNQVGDRNAPQAGRVGVGEVGDALELLPLAQHQLEQIELRLIAEARDRRMSWAEIAERLSMRSRQAAEQRYLRLKSAHSISGGGRDVVPARAQRRRRNELLELVEAKRTTLRRLARLLPTALEEDLYATATGPTPKNAGPTWDRLPVDERATRRDHLMGQLAPHLRTLRTSIAEEVAEPLDLFLALGYLIVQLDRNGYQFGNLPSELTGSIDEVRDVMAKFGARTFAAPPTTSTRAADSR